MGPVVQGVEIDERQIRTFPRFNRTCEMSDMQCPGAQTGRHGQHHARRNGGRIAGFSLGDEGRQTHLFEHIQIVVGCRAIGSQADIHAGFQHISNGCKS